MAHRASVPCGRLESAGTAGARSGSGPGGAALAGALGYFTRFGDAPAHEYALASLAVPLTWACAVALAHGYESRFLGVSSEEYRAVARAAAVLVAVVALASYAGQLRDRPAVRHRHRSRSRWC